MNYYILQQLRHTFYKDFDFYKEDLNQLNYQNIQLPWEIIKYCTFINFSSNNNLYTMKNFFDYLLNFEEDINIKKEKIKYFKETLKNKNFSNLLISRLSYNINMNKTIKNNQELLEIIFNLLEKTNYNPDNIENIFKICFLSKNEDLIQSCQKYLINDKRKKSYTFAIYDIFYKLNVVKELKLFEKNNNIDINKLKVEKVKANIYYAYKDIVPLHNKSLMEQMMQVFNSYSINDIDNLIESMKKYLPEEKINYNITSQTKNQYANGVDHYSIDFFLTKYDSSSFNININTEIINKTIKTILNEGYLKDFDKYLCSFKSNKNFGLHFFGTLSFKNEFFEKNKNIILTALSNIDLVFNKKEKRRKNKKIFLKSLFINNCYSSYSYYDNNNNNNNKIINTVNKNNNYLLNFLFDLISINCPEYFKDMKNDFLKTKEKYKKYSSTQKPLIEEEILFTLIEKKLLSTSMEKNKNKNNLDNSKLFNNKKINKI